MVESVDSPNGWQQLDRDDRHSTVAHFITGFECVVEIGDANRGDEVLIWQGVPELVEPDDGEPYEKTVFEGYDDDEVPDGADYLIEVHVDGEPQSVSNPFALDLDEAIDKALTHVERLHSQ